MQPTRAIQGGLSRTQSPLTGLERGLLRKRVARRVRKRDFPLITERLTGKRHRGDGGAVSIRLRHSRVSLNHGQDTRANRTRHTSPVQPAPRGAAEPTDAHRTPVAADSTEETTPGEPDPAASRSQSASPRLLESGRRNEGAMGKAGALQKYQKRSSPGRVRPEPPMSSRRERRMRACATAAGRWRNQPESAASSKASRS